MRNKEFLHHRGSSRDSQFTGINPRRSRSTLPEVSSKSNKVGHDTNPAVPCTLASCTVHKQPVWQGRHSSAEVLPRLFPPQESVPSAHSRSKDINSASNLSRRQGRRRTSRSNLKSQFPTILRALVAENAE